MRLPRCIFALRCMTWVCLAVLLGGCGGKGGGALISQPGEPQTPGPSAAFPPPSSVPLRDVVAEIQAAEPLASVDSELWDELTAELVRVLEARGTSQVVQHPPEGLYNQVPDLALVDDGIGGFNLEWTYCNVGDYNQDGLVSINDLTPIGQFYNASSGDPVWDEAQLADGNGDGMVTINDVTQIGQNYLSFVSAYRVNGSYLYFGPWDELGSVAFAEGQAQSPLSFTFPLGDDSYSTYHVAPLDGSGIEGVPSAALSAAPPRFTAPLTVSPEAGFTSFDYELVFTIGLAESVGVPLSIELVEVDGSGNEIAVLSDLYDDGDPDHADEGDGDLIFSTKATINRAAEGGCYFVARVELDDGEGIVSINSNTVVFQLFAELTDARLDEISEQLDVFTAQLKDLRVTLPGEEADAAMVELLLVDPTVSEAGALAEGDGVYYRTADGIGCEVYFPDPMIYGGEGAGSSASAAMLPPESNAKWDSFVDASKAASALETDVPRNRKVLVLAAFERDFYEYAAGHVPYCLFTEFNELLGENSCRRYKPVLYVDYYCDLAAFKQMHEYGVIIIITHGTYHPLKREVNLATGRRYEVHVTKLSESEKLDLCNDFLSLEKIVDTEFGDEDIYLAIDQDYIESRIGPLPGSIVFLGACHSGRQDLLPDAFLRIGAKTVYGFDKKANYCFATDVCEEIINALLAGKHTEEIFEKNPQLGVDPYNMPWYFPPGVPRNDVQLVKRPAGEKQALELVLYDVIPVIPLQGYETAAVVDINNEGQVLGYYYSGKIADTARVFVMRVHDDGSFDIEAVGPEGAHFLPNGINDKGLVVGASIIEDPLAGYFASTMSGPAYDSVINLDPQGDRVDSAASAVNNLGVITGFANWVYDPYSDPDQGIWSGRKAMVYNGGFTDLGIFTDARNWGGVYCGYAINESGEVVGYAERYMDNTFQYKAFYYRSGTMYSLPAPQPGKSTFAYDINEASWAVGSASYWPYMWKVGTYEHFTLPCLREIRGDACSINDSQQVVGSVGSCEAVGTGGNCAVLWEKDKPTDAFGDYANYSVYDLNCLLSVPLENRLIAAWYINNKGQIACEDKLGNWFILVPRSEAE
jgi:probable HAF family extracellular repeat protein